MSVNYYCVQLKSEFRILSVPQSRKILQYLIWHHAASSLCAQCNIGFRTDFCTWHAVKCMWSNCTHSSTFLSMTIICLCTCTVWWSSDGDRGDERMACWLTACVHLFYSTSSNVFKRGALPDADSSWWSPCHGMWLSLAWCKQAYPSQCSCSVTAVVHDQWKSLRFIIP